MSFDLHILCHIIDKTNKEQLLINSNNNDDDFEEMNSISNMLSFRSLMNITCNVMSRNFI